ncbi:GNAT family N-acetyltransferase [Microbacterium sp. SS28]|uniref:GNAT family N-acetyltransferase n=1 Tax=Microbacterium sp. SS28 TaxID=2919948 RepID=UPI001FAB346C|nr:GNAT family N-acetyltransferase [Microbacterium sp. SS28]
MVELRPLPVDEPVAHELLAEYFAMRAAAFPGQAYTTVFPAPTVFEAPSGVFVVVYDDEGIPVGCGGIRRIADGPLGVRYEIKHLYLRPETRGRGWGRLILDDLERRAREWDAAELVLDTHHTLEAAGGLYASAGFREIEPYNDNPNATRWYARRLAGVDDAR